MFWILSYLFKMFVNIVNILLNITSGVIWLMPVIKNLLLSYSSICLTSVLVLKLHEFCKYVATLEQNKTRNKTQNNVSFVSEFASNDHKSKSIVKDSDGNRNNKFRNTKDYWNKNQSLSSLNSTVDHKLKNKHNKAKSLDELTFTKHQQNAVEKGASNQIPKDFRNNNARNVSKNNSSPFPNKRQNIYGKVNHKTIFVNTNEEESSDDLELLSSDDDSILSKVKMNEKLVNYIIWIYYFRIIARSKVQIFYMRNPR